MLGQNKALNAELRNERKRNKSHIPKELVKIKDFLLDLLLPWVLLWMWGSLYFCSFCFVLLAFQTRSVLPRLSSNSEHQMGTSSHPDLSFTFRKGNNHRNIGHLN